MAKDQGDEMILPKFNADTIAELVNAAGFDCMVAQTGGGCATIYAGPTETDPDGEPRSAVVAGPGTYGWGHKPSVFGDGELWIGPDDNGATKPTDAYAVGCRDEQDVADLILAYCRYHSRTEPLDADTLESLGFDSAGRYSPRRDLD